MKETFPWEASSAESPAYLAVTVCLPFLSFLTLAVATPFFTVALIFLTVFLPFLTRMLTLPVAGACRR